MPTNPKSMSMKAGETFEGPPAISFATAGTIHLPIPDEVFTTPQPERAQS
jgi:hypothetical protein